MKKWEVRIVGGESKKQLTDMKYAVPCRNEKEGREWGLKQAAAIGIADPMVTVKEIKDAETPVDVAPAVAP